MTYISTVRIAFDNLLHHTLLPYSFTKKAVKNLIGSEMSWMFTLLDWVFWLPSKIYCLKWLMLWIDLHRLIVQTTPDQTLCTNYGIDRVLVVWIQTECVIQISSNASRGWKSFRENESCDEVAVIKLRQRNAQISLLQPVGVSIIKKHKLKSGWEKSDANFFYLRTQDTAIL